MQKPQFWHYVALATLLALSTHSGRAQNVEQMPLPPVNGETLVIQGTDSKIYPLAPTPVPAAHALAVAAPAAQAVAPSDPLVDQLRALIDGQTHQLGGLLSKDFKLDYAKRIPSRVGHADFEYVHFTQMVQDAEIPGSGISFSISHLPAGPRILRRTAQVFPAAAHAFDALAKDRDEVVLAHAGARLRKFGIKTAPQKFGRKLRFVNKAWHMVDEFGDGDTPVVAAVDVHTGETFLWDGRYFVTAQGTVRGRAFDVEPDYRAEGSDPYAIAPNDPVEQPLPHIQARWSQGGTAAITDPSGAFTSDLTGIFGHFTSTLVGSFVNVKTSTGPALTANANVLPTGQIAQLRMNPTTSPTEYAGAQVNAYVHINRVHDWLVARGIDPPGINVSIPVKVNVKTDICGNAYFATLSGKSVGFTFGTSAHFKDYFSPAEGTCANPALPSIIYHEYGHFVDNSIGGITNTGLSEGWGDIISTFMRNRSALAPSLLPAGFYSRDASIIRSYDPSDEAHSQGAAFMSFAWRVREALIARYGPDDGAAKAEDLFLPVLWANSKNIPAAIEEVYLRDDEDGNVATPSANFDLISAAAKQGDLPESALPDTKPPTIRLTLPHGITGPSGAPVTIAAAATDNIRVTRVQFKVNGQNFGPALRDPPYQTIWNTTGLSGAYTISAEAADSGGNMTSTAQFKFTLLADKTPPVLTLVSPKNGAVLAGQQPITLQALATDNVKVASVQFKVNGVNQGPALTAPPYTTPWDISVLSGAQTVTVDATDSAGNKAVTRTAKVTVVADPTRPSVALAISPKPGVSTVTGTLLTLTAAPKDNRGVYSVQFQMDGNDLGPVITKAPYTFKWLTKGLADAEYKITAVVTDTSNNKATSNMIPVKLVSDKSAPTVTLTAPKNGAKYATRTPITLTAAAKDNVALQSVQFKINGVDFGQPLRAAPFTLPYTTPDQGGSVVISVVATDTSDLTQTSQVTITVTPDAAPPTVKFTGPAPGFTLFRHEVLHLVATASDDHALAGVQFSVGGTAVGPDFIAHPKTPYSYDFRTTTELGNLNLGVVSRDAQGNRTSDSVQVNVIKDTTPPDIDLEDGAVEHNYIGFPFDSFVEVTDNSMVARYQVKLGNQVVMERTIDEEVREKEEFVDISNDFTTAGQYTYTVTAWDAENNTSTKTITVNVEDF